MRSVVAQTEAKTQVLNVTKKPIEMVDVIEDGLIYFYLSHTATALRS